MNQPRFDPSYVQISPHQAAEILGISIKEFDHRRRSDRRCPTGFVDRHYWMATMKFRLSDIYTYSEVIMKSSDPDSTEPTIVTD